jgi:translation initiation factor 1
MVTVVSGLPRDEEYLKNLSKTLKVKTGSGGTFYSSGEMGVIEIQGDKRKDVEQILHQEAGS